MEWGFWSPKLVSLTSEAGWVWRPACFCSLWQDSRAKWGRYSGTFIKKPDRPCQISRLLNYCRSSHCWWYRLFSFLGDGGGRRVGGARNHLKSQKLKPVSGACGSEGGPPKQICMNSSGYGNVIELHCCSHWVDIETFQLMGHNNIHIKIKKNGLDWGCAFTL